MDYILIGVSDSWARLISEPEFKKVEKQIEEFDGIDGFVHLGVLNNPTIDEAIEIAKEKGYSLDLVIIDSKGLEDL